MSDLYEDIKGIGCFLIILSILIFFSPGFFVACIVNWITPISIKTIWGISIAISIIVIFICAWLTGGDDTMVAYLWTAFSTTVIMVLLCLFLDNDNFISRTVIKSFPIFDEKKERVIRNNESPIDSTATFSNPEVSKKKKSKTESIESKKHEEENTSENNTDSTAEEVEVTQEVQINDEVNTNSTNKEKVD